MTSIYTERRLINLNSLNATQYNNGTLLSDVMFNFTNVLKEEQDIVLVEGGLLNAQIPVSFYTINQYNNILNYTLSTGVFTISVQYGNYNYLTLKTAMETAFSSNLHAITLSINSVNGKISFTNTTSGATFTNCIEIGSTIWAVLGFKIGGGNVSAVSNVVSPQFPLNLLGIKKIKIFSDAVGILAYDSSNLGGVNLIDCLSVNEASYGLISYSNTQNIYSKVKRKWINQIDIQLRDEFSNLIDFNNTGWTITLCLIIYRKYTQEENDLQKYFDRKIVPLLKQLDTDIKGNTENTDTENTVNPNPSLDVGSLDLDPDYQLLIS